MSIEKTFSTGGIGLCAVRPDIIEKGLFVPVGENHYIGEGIYQYREREEDDLFEIFAFDQWLEAYSIDFIFL